MRPLVSGGAGYVGSVVAAHLALLNAMRLAATPRIVFSSTAAVHDEPERIPIQETRPTRPTNPYGASPRLAVDTALSEYARLYGFGAVSLRYFNVAGAQQATDGSRLGERHAPETHRIPNVPAGAASSRGIQSDLGWQARRDLRAMIADAWQFTQVQVTQGRK